MFNESQMEIIAQKLGTQEPFASASKEQVVRIGDVLEAASFAPVGQDVEYLLEVADVRNGDSDELVRSAASLCLEVLGERHV